MTLGQGLAKQKSEIGGPEKGIVFKGRSQRKEELGNEKNKYLDVKGLEEQNPYLHVGKKIVFHTVLRAA